MGNDWGGDFEIFLVAPGAAHSMVLMSDAGAATLSNYTITFDDAAASLLPQNSVPSSPATVRPADYQELVGPGAPADTYPNAPAGLGKPAPTGSATLANTFNGIAPNGVWSLYVLNDACDTPAEMITNGWTIDITTGGGTATARTVTSSPNPSLTGQSVAFTASVTSGGPVTSGTVTFTEGATTLAANLALNGSGQATFSSSPLTEGNHVITATYNGTATLATSNGSVNQVVNTPTSGTSPTFCNSGSIAVRPASAIPSTTPYPSNLTVSGLSGNISTVTATLKGVSHPFAEDIDVLLVGPNSANNLVLVSDAGSGPTTNVTETFSDAGPALVPATGPWAAPNTSVTAKPTDYTPLGDVDTFPSALPPISPAPGTLNRPAPTGAATLTSAFGGSNPNGTWSLYVRDDGAPETGAIASGWCLNFTTFTPPTLSTTASPGVVPGGLVHDTATLAGGVSPTGTITFRLFGPGDATCVGPPVFTSVVPVAGNGSYDSPNFTPTAAGTYLWVASYSGDVTNAAVAGVCNAVGESVTVAKVTPTLSTTASAGVILGGQVHDTATLGGGSSPTGTITFDLYGPGDATCTGPAVFSSTVPVAGNGSYDSASFTPTAAGTYQWRARYSGDIANDPVVGVCNALGESVIVSPLTTPTLSTTASPGVVPGGLVHD
ncbi:MAG: Ig-like domain repeat protein, partial [Jatrophihabitantaceae bacterium]